MKAGNPAFERRLTVTREQYLHSLTPPKGMVDVVLDTDAYNEIDDQFAIAYLLRSKEKCHTVALYAAPFLNHRSVSAEDGMEKSFAEIEKLQKLMGESVPVYKGSARFLENETTPVVSPAAEDLVKRAKQYSPDHPLYVVAIGAITNIASALLLDPSIAENIVVVWLGGNARHFKHTKEFNMTQDIAAARVVMGSPAPFVQLPCAGVVDSFDFGEAELRRWLWGKNPLCDYLVENTVAYMQKGLGENFEKKPWTKVIWDVCAVAWLFSGVEEALMDTAILPRVLPDYNNLYEQTALSREMVYVNHIYKNNLFWHLICALS